MNPPKPHPASLETDQLLAECDTTRTRRSGPGGQYRNKVETAVILEHRPTGLKAEANERRYQHENLEVATFRLRVRLALEVRTQLLGDSPSTLWMSRIRDGKIFVNPAHNDFPTLLAEALDVLHPADYEPKPSAAFLQCTPSQLIKFLKLDPQVFAAINRQRLALGRKILM